MPGVDQPDREPAELRGPPDRQCFYSCCMNKLGLRQSLDSLFRKHGNRFLDHGGLTMRKRSLLFLSLLVPAFLVLGGYAVVKAQQRTSSAAKGKRWSDAATWPDKKVPGKDAAVTIGKDMNVVLDVSPMPLRSLTIEGKLSFADKKDLELTTEWVMVHGELEIGTEARPHTRKATITLTDNVKDEDMSGMGGTNDRSDRGIMLMGGTLNLHGMEKNSWTKLAKTAAAGSNTIEVLNPGDWKKGQTIVVASTDRSEERRVGKECRSRGSRQH